MPTELTRRKMAEEIAENVSGLSTGRLIKTIEDALRNRDERAAEIAKAHNELHTTGDCGYQNCGLAIAERILS